jgi:hypothetical protein
MENTRLRKPAPTAVNVTVGRRRREYLTEREVERSTGTRWQRYSKRRSQTDDNELIYFSYNGVIQCSEEQSDRLNAGEELKTGDCHFITAPTFETKSEKYGWINCVQAVGKMVSLKGGDHITYDIFAVK